MPQDPGVYLFLGENNEILYIGKAKNLKKRVSSYFQKNLGDKTSLLISEVKKIKTIKVSSEIESLLLEARLIQKYFPKYNVRFADGKSYPLIKVTIKDKFPKVLVARRMDDKNSLYFGPYPDVSSMRLVLKIARRIFPFQSVLRHQNKLCFYNHIGLCPCPELTNDLSYRKNILHLVDFLNGKTNKVLKELEKERGKESKIENFEKANEIQRKIEAIKKVTSSFFRPLEYEENPNLRDDIINEELSSLKKKLNENSIAVKNLKRIECYDISNISGKFATGSMVVFTNGEKDSSEYRRFKIKKVEKPDDFAMMEETLTRRFKNNWALPSLIIVDGGKGQVTAALDVLKRMKLSIPLVGLAKKEELIVNPNLEEIRLPKDSKSLHLIMRIRDEAHRFALTYHKLLRNRIVIGEI